MKQAQKIIGRRMMLIAANPEKHAAFILQLRLQERKSRYLSGQPPSVAEQIAWMQARERLADDAYFVICEVGTPDTPLGTIRLHDVIPEEHSIRVSSWVMADGVAPKKTLEALALALEYAIHAGYPNCHYEVHKNTPTTLRFYTKLGTHIAGEKTNTLILGVALPDFLRNMSTIYHMPAAHIQSTQF